MPRQQTGRRALTALGLGGIILVGGCHSDDLPVHGKVVLCPTGTVVGPAAIVVRDASEDKPVVRTVARDTDAAGVCTAVAAAAAEAGFKTQADDPGTAAVKILADDPEDIVIDVKNVRVLTQVF